MEVMGVARRAGLRSEHRAGAPVPHPVLSSTWTFGLRLTGLSKIVKWVKNA